MAEKRNFDLNKKSTRNFDLGKENTSRTFDLTKEVDDVATDKTADVVKPSYEEPSPSRNNLKWLWIALAIIVIILLVWWLIPSSNSSVQEGTEEVVPENVITPSDETTNINNNETSVNDAETAVINEVKSEEVVVETPEHKTTEPEEPLSNPVSSSNPTAPASNSINTDTMTTVNVSSDIEAEALKVIRGDYGIGNERKEKLGSLYQVIQNRVNELKREGVF